MPRKLSRGTRLLTTAGAAAVAALALPGAASAAECPPQPASPASAAFGDANQYRGSTDSSGGSISPDDHRSWAPSRYVELKTDSIPVGESGVATVAFRSQGDWKVDDVHVDPYRR